MKHKFVRTKPNLTSHLDEYKNLFDDDSLSKILSMNSTHQNVVDDISQCSDSSDHSSLSSSMQTQSTDKQPFKSQDIFDYDSSSTNIIKNH